MGSRTCRRGPKHVAVQTVPQYSAPIAGSAPPSSRATTGLSQPSSDNAKVTGKLSVHIPPSSGVDGPEHHHSTIYDPKYSIVGHPGRQKMKDTNPASVTPAFYIEPRGGVPRVVTGASIVAQGSSSATCSASTTTSNASAPAGYSAVQSPPRLAAVTKG